VANPAKRASSASFALFVLFAINLLNFFDRQLPGALAEPIRREFHLSDTTLGLLGTVATLMYALVGLPLGRLADKWSRTRLIAIGTAAWSLLTAASGLAQNYAQLFVSRLGVGLGEATCAPAGQSLIGDLFPPHQRARAMGIFMLGLPAGLSLAYFSAGAIGAAFGWRAAFLFACIPGLLFAWLADKMSAKRRDGRLLCAACSMAVAAPSIFFALNQPKGSIAAFMLLMAIGTMTMFVYYATVYAAIQDVIEPRLRGTAVAIYFCAMYVLGASLGPLGLGLLSDHFAHRAMVVAGAGAMTEAFKASGLHSAMYAIPVLAVLASLVLFAGSRTVEGDIRKQERSHGGE
jgi:MFS family permease